MQLERLLADEPTPSCARRRASNGYQRLNQPLDSLPGLLRDRGLTFVKMVEAGAVESS